MTFISNVAYKLEYMYSLTLCIVYFILYGSHTYTQQYIYMNNPHLLYNNNDNNIYMYQAMLVQKSANRTRGKGYDVMIFFSRRPWPLIGTI